MYYTVCLDCQISGAADHLDPASIITARRDDFCEVDVNGGGHVVGAEG